MAPITLSHITDLHKLSDEDLVQFAKELPLIVKSFRTLALAAKAEGKELAEIFTSIAWVGEMKDFVEVRAEGRTLVLDESNIDSFDLKTLSAKTPRP